MAIIGSSRETHTADKGSSSSAKLSGWARVEEYLRKHDSGMVNDYSDDIDTLLVFAGLFSAVLTAFVVQTYQLLQPDGSTTTNQLLAYGFASQLASQGPMLSSSFNDTIASLVSSSHFTPSASVRCLNILFFLSLVLSLAAAFFGILAKQWLREYLRWNAATGTPQENVLVRQIRFEAWEAWNVSATISSIPALLELAMILFLIGVVILLWMLDSIVAIVVTIVAVIFLGLVIMFTILPVMVKRCPYRSPTAWACVVVFHYLGQALYYAGTLLRRLFMLISWKKAQRAGKDHAVAESGKTLSSTSNPQLLSKPKQAPGVSGESQLWRTHDIHSIYQDSEHIISTLNSRSNADDVNAMQQRVLTDYINEAAYILRALHWVQVVFPTHEQAPTLINDSLFSWKPRAPLYEDYRLSSRFHELLAVQNAGNWCLLISETINNIEHPYLPLVSAVKQDEDIHIFQPHLFDNSSSFLKTISSLPAAFVQNGASSAILPVRKAHWIALLNEDIKQFDHLTRRSDLSLNLFALGLMVSRLKAGTMLLAHPSNASPVETREIVRAINDIFFMIVNFAFTIRWKTLAPEGRAIFLTACQEILSDHGNDYIQNTLERLAPGIRLAAIYLATTREMPAPIELVLGQARTSIGPYFVTSGSAGDTDHAIFEAKLDTPSCREEDLAIVLVLAGIGGTASMSRSYNWDSLSTSTVVDKLIKLTEAIEQYVQRYDAIQWKVPLWSWIEENRVSSEFWATEEACHVRRFYHALEKLFIADKINISRNPVRSGGYTAVAVLHCLLRDSHLNLADCPEEGCRWIKHTRCEINSAFERASGSSTAMLLYECCTYFHHLSSATAFETERSGDSGSWPFDSTEAQADRVYDNSVVLERLSAGMMSSRTDVAHIQTAQSGAVGRGKSTPYSDPTVQPHDAPFPDSPTTESLSSAEQGESLVVNPEAAADNTGTRRNVEHRNDPSATTDTPSPSRSPTPDETVEARREQAGESIPLTALRPKAPST